MMETIKGFLYLQYKKHRFLELEMFMWLKNEKNTENYSIFIPKALGATRKFYRKVHCNC